LIAQLSHQKWRGAIIGPHGSGKSTLLETLIRPLQLSGVTVYAITLQNAQRRLPAGFLPAAPRERSLLVIDGYEQLAWFERYRLNRHCRRTRCGLLVTSHAPLNISTLIELNPDSHLVQKLVEELSARVLTPVRLTDVLSSRQRHGANVREIFFDLYDRHEQLQHRICGRRL
jgi:ABC-type Mn2+/Zn2+ transport system ATPase subunit